MALTERYLNTDLATGANDGTSEADAWQTWAAAAAGVAAGQRVNVKRTASPVQLPADVDCATGGTKAAPIVWRAYETTPGDGGIVEVGIAASSANRHLGFSGDFQMVEGLVQRLYTRAPNYSSPGGLFYRCAIANLPSAHGPLFLKCAFDNALMASPGNGPVSAAAVGCYFKADANQTGYALNLNVAFGTRIAIGNVFNGAAAAGNGSAAIRVTNANTARGVLVAFNSIYGHDYGIDFVNCLDTGSSLAYAAVLNNVIYSCLVGIRNQDGTGDVGCPLIGNAIGGATTARMSGLDDAFILNDITLTADPYVDAANEDFSLNDAAGGGALCRGAGAPAALADAGIDDFLTTYWSVGALQLQGGSTGGVLLASKRGGAKQ